MNSVERKELRYKRRKLKRENKRKQYQKSFDEVFNFVNLYRAGKNSCKGSRWKTSTINFETMLLTNVETLLQKVRNKYRYEGFVYFQTVEHGKMRDIHSLSVRDRTVQRCYCDEIMINAYSRSFVNENSASLKGKGYMYALNKITTQLRSHYEKYGLNGAIYQFDLKSYFASLSHEIIRKRIGKNIDDVKLRENGCEFVSEFNDLVDGTRGYGVGLGSPVSQIIALDYSSPLDHYIKDELHCEYYGRYMDDGYVILPSIEKAKQIQSKVRNKIKQLGIAINSKKDIITSIRSHSFSFLKIRFTLTSSGRVVKKLNRNSIKAIRRKLKVFRKWCDEKDFDFEDVCTSYQSWRGFASYMNSYKTVINIDRLFVKLFEKELSIRPTKFKCSLQAKWNDEIGWIYYSSEKELKNILDKLDETRYTRYMNGFKPIFMDWKWREINKSKNSAIFNNLRQVVYGN